MGVSLRLLTQVAGSPLVEKYGLTETLNRLLRQGTEAGFQVAAQATTAFNKVIPREKPARREPSPEGKPKVFDLRPTDEQEMIQDTMRRFASDVIAGVAEEADASCATPDDVLNGVQELGLLTLAVPSELGGDAESRSPLTNAIALEALATGDLGLALAAASPLGVACA